MNILPHQYLPEIIGDDWINKLDAAIQLQLSIKLIDIIMPEWEKYIAKKLTEHNLPAEKYFIETDNFLCQALQAVKNNASIIILHDNSKYNKIKICLDEFIYLVTSMCDEEYPVPYMIKKIIMALFNIINGVEQNTATTNCDHFSKSIHLSIEIIEQFRVITMNKLHHLLKEYKVLAEKQMPAKLNNNILTT